MNEANNNAAAAVAHRQRKHHSVKQDKTAHNPQWPNRRSNTEAAAEASDKTVGRELARWCHNNTAQDPLESKCMAHAPCSQLGSFAGTAIIASPF